LNVLTINTRSPRRIVQNPAPKTIGHMQYLHTRLPEITP